MEECDRGLLPPAVDVNPAHLFLSQTGVVPYKPKFCSLLLAMVMECTEKGI